MICTVCKLPSVHQPMQDSLPAGDQVPLTDRTGAWPDCLPLSGHKKNVAGPQGHLTRYWEKAVVINIVENCLLLSCS